LWYTDIIAIQSAVNELTFEVLYNAIMVTKTQVVLAIAKILAFPMTS